MQIVIEIPDAHMRDYQDLFYKVHGIAASEGLFDDKEKSQTALTLKVVLDILDGIVNGIPLPEGHGRLIDETMIAYNDGVFEDGTTYTVIFPHDIENTPTIIEADKE